MLPQRPLRSVFIGDTNYASLYRFGVEQGMARLGHWHRTVSLRQEPHVVQRLIREMRPDLVFTHMLLWPPSNALCSADALKEMAFEWRQNGAVVFLHDGDPRTDTRHPHPIDDIVDFALLNYKQVPPEWSVPGIYWPYAAPYQARIGHPQSSYQCDLLFAGLLREGELYGKRTQLVQALASRIHLRVHPDLSGLNTRMLIADWAPSANAVLGVGRPEQVGWLDTRIFSVAGAGGVLIHDDAAAILEPDEHFIQCEQYSVDSVVEGVYKARQVGAGIRQKAFDFVQAHHTWTHRCQQVIDVVYR